MVMIMRRVVAITIRATTWALPGYGVSSSLNQPQSHVMPVFAAGGDWAIDAISMAANHDDC
jgi:hypothetical protein